MPSWRDVTDYFSASERHYKDVYLAICMVFDEILEVSLFSSLTDSYEIYFSYNRFFGIIYVNEQEARAEYKIIRNK